MAFSWGVWVFAGRFVVMPAWSIISVMMAIASPAMAVVPTVQYSQLMSVDCTMPRAFVGTLQHL